MGLFRRKRAPFVCGGVIGFPPAGGPAPIDLSDYPMSDERCPTCDAPTVHIFYGVGSPLLYQLVAAGRARPGGGMFRVLGGDANTHRCNACETDFVGKPFDILQPSEGVDEVKIRCRIHSVTIRLEHQYLAEQLGTIETMAAATRGFFEIEGRPCDVWSAETPTARRTFVFDVSDSFPGSM